MPTPEHLEALAAAEAQHAQASIEFRQTLASLLIPAGLSLLTLITARRRHRAVAAQLAIIDTQAHDIDDDEPLRCPSTQRFPDGTVARCEFTTRVAHNEHVLLRDDGRPSLRWGDEANDVA